MTTRRISTPDGAAWSVRRRWLPHREGKGVVQRFRKNKGDGGNLLDVPDLGGDGLTGIAVAIALAILLFVLIVFGWPLILIGIDLAWLALVGLIGVIGRIVLRRPWRVEAVSAGERRSWFVKGYRAAGERRDEVARQLQHGQNPAGQESAPVTH